MTTFSSLSASDGDSPSPYHVPIHTGQLGSGCNLSSISNETHTVEPTFGTVNMP